MADPGPLVISEIRSWACSFPLPRPFILGRSRVDRRGYTILRIETNVGFAGVAFTLNRGAPLDVLLSELFAPHLVGLDVLELSDLDNLRRARFPHHAAEGLLLRAQSLIDIALWDIRGKALGKPVWRLFADDAHPVPVMLVEGYPIEGEEDESFAERVCAAVEAGYRTIKLANLADDPERMTRRLRRVRELIGDEPDLTVDIGFCWDDRESALSVAKAWREFRLAWIEDPAHGDEVDRIAWFHETIDTPLAVGDEVTNLRTIGSLLERGAIDILRADATCLGGLTGLREVHRLANSREIPISTHIYPEIHRHLACVLPSAGPVEAFLPGTPFDAPHMFSLPPVTTRAVSTGERVAHVPSEPGLGLQIDWESVSRFSLRELGVS